ncbi:MAG TPA: glycine oxidase ThiO [Dongiaceae bacterium]|nr:glycine oxidase ThiO [Dongiaceae bacterium]
MQTLSAVVPANATRVLIRGAGVAGLSLAYELAQRGLPVKVAEKRAQLAGNASWQAGGMLAPWCECETAERIVLTLGRRAIDWWDEALPGEVVRNGTLVLAQPRDRRELDRFARRTAGHVLLDRATLAGLEPDLADRFADGLFFAGEAHLDPRRALTALQQKLQSMGVAFCFARDGAESAQRQVEPAGPVADCTGIAAASPALRGVRGEMLILRCPDVTLSRPVRLLHPRFPIYIVPRADHHFMVGATMIESDAAGPVTARSVIELLNAAYALHPAFAEAEIIEAGVGIRPAFPDNLPRVKRDGDIIQFNGLYRHGFLLAPAMAEKAANLIIGLMQSGRVLHETHH